MMTLPPPFIKALPEMAARYGLDLVVAFGSAVSGPRHEGSDLDLAVQAGSAPLSRENFARLHTDLSIAAGAVAVDLVDLRRADPFLLQQIAANPVLLFGTGPVYQSFLLRAFHTTEDYRPYLELEQRLVRARLAAG